MESFAEYIHDLMSRRAISLRSLAARAGVSPAHLSRVLREDRARPTAAFVDALAFGLEQPYSALLYRAGLYFPEIAERHRPLLQRLHPEVERSLSVLLFSVYRIGDTFSRSRFSSISDPTDIQMALNTVFPILFERFKALIASDDYEALTMRYSELVDKAPEFLHSRVRRDRDQSAAIREREEETLKAYFASAKELCLDLLYQACTAILANTDPQATMDALLSQTAVIDPDEFLLLFDLIPEKYYLFDHTPHFAEKLGRLSAWLKYVVESYSPGQDEAGTNTTESLAGFWTYYLDIECREEFFSEQKRRQKPTAFAETDAPEKQFSQIEAAGGRFSLKVDYQQGVTTITVALPCRVEDALPFIHQIVAIYQKWSESAL